MYYPKLSRVYFVDIFLSSLRGENLHAHSIISGRILWVSGCDSGGEAHEIYHKGESHFFALFKTHANSRELCSVPGAALCPPALRILVTTREIWHDLTGAVFYQYISRCGSFFSAIVRDVSRRGNFHIRGAPTPGSIAWNDSIRCNAEFKYSWILVCYALVGGIKFAMRCKYVGHRHRERERYGRVNKYRHCHPAAQSWWHSPRRN